MPKYLDPMFAALADTTRRNVVERLSHGPATVSALAANYAMSLPAFVQHLGVLEKAGLVVSQKQGRVRTCYLQTTAMQDLEGWMIETRQFWENRIDALADYAEAQHQQSVTAQPDKSNKER
ncbi:MAG: metalloregulator ArsR/SmtB family transcription factor [Pseudomonadota bacterium]